MQTINTFSKAKALAANCNAIGIGPAQVDGRPPRLSGDMEKVGVSESSYLSQAALETKSAATGDDLFGWEFGIVLTTANGKSRHHSANGIANRFYSADPYFGVKEQLVELGHIASVTDDEGVVAYMTAKLPAATVAGALADRIKALLG